MTKLIHSTDQYKIFEEEISLEDSSDVSRVLTIEFEGEKKIELTFAFGKLVNKKEDEN